MKLNTLFVGNVARHFTELESTNLYATNLLAKTKPSEGTVISADYQTAGRGQIGRSWHASPGKNVLLSLILHPRWLLARDQFSLSQCVALAVADTVSVFCASPAAVKWPNDVYLGNQKIAGILIQNSLVGSYLQWSVIGIGLNINEESFPSELPQACSLRQMVGEELNLTAVKQQLFHKLEQRYLQLKARPAQIRADYLQQLYQYQSWHTYRRRSDQQLFRGQIIGVQKSGKLAIQNEGGSVEYFDLKEVAFTQH